MICLHSQRDARTSSHGSSEWATLVWVARIGNDGEKQLHDYYAVAERSGAPRSGATRGVVNETASPNCCQSSKRGLALQVQRSADCPSSLWFEFTAPDGDVTVGEKMGGCRGSAILRQSTTGIRYPQIRLAFGNPVSTRINQLLVSSVYPVSIQDQSAIGHPVQLQYRDQISTVFLRRDQISQALSRTSLCLRIVRTVDEPQAQR